MNELPGSRGKAGTVCVLADRWPRVSSTFVAQELVGLEKEGLHLWLGTWGKPDKVDHPIVLQLQAPVHRVPASPVITKRFREAWLKVRKKPGYPRAFSLLKSDMAQRHRPPLTLVKYFARAVILAAEMPPDTRIIYAHFLNLTTTIARYASAILELPLAASGHARDIWTAPETELRTKLAQLAWCATCTSSGAERLRGLTDEPGSIHLIHHGLSFERFPRDIPGRAWRNGSDLADPVQLLSVGRAVEKKGFDDVLAALAELPSDLVWQWHHVGPGPLIPKLQDLARTLGIADRVTWHGAKDQSTVMQHFRTSDLFILPSREAGDGDRDGLPNVLMEAQSQALACLSTRFSAIPELIIDGETGVMVEPGDVGSLTGALEQLIRNPSERERLGIAGYHRVRRDFEADAGIGRLASLLRQSMI